MKKNKKKEKIKNYYTRGGSLFNWPIYAQVTKRHYVSANFSEFFFGFRLIKLLK